MGETVEITDSDRLMRRENSALRLEDMAGGGMTSPGQLTQLRLKQQNLVMEDKK